MVVSPHKASTVQGYGIIELLLVVLLIGILSSITYISYQKYSNNARRVQMMVVLQNVAIEIHAQKLTQAGYPLILSSIFPEQDWTVSTSDTGADVAQTNLINTSPSFNYPSAGAVLYQITITPLSVDGQHLESAQWQLTATPHPQGIMHRDGVISLNFEGRKCHRDKCRYDDSWQ